jgi:hypothetical protein
VVSFTPRALYTEGKNPRYPLDRRLGGLQSRSGEKNLAPRQVLNSGRPARRPSVYRLSYLNLFNCLMVYYNQSV